MVTGLIIVAALFAAMLAAFAAGFYIGKEIALAACAEEVTNAGSLEDARERIYNK